MLRYLRICRWWCVALVLPLATGLVFGDEGVVGNLVVPAGPACPGCRAPCSGPCPANVKYFGYYPTRWRRWPGTEEEPTVAPPAEGLQPEHVEVPSPEQEATGKPGATSETGAVAPPAGSTTDPNSSNTPANPNGAAPGAAAPRGAVPGGAAPGGAAGAGVPMLNGLPLPNGARFPNGAPLPNGPSSNNGPIPNDLSASQPPDDAAKNAPLPAPAQLPAPSPLPSQSQTPSAAPLRTIPSEPEKLNQVWPPSTQPSAQPTATMIGQRIAPDGAAPSYQWPPPNMLRSPNVKAGFQAPAETSAPAASPSATSSAWDEPLPPLNPPSRIHRGEENNSLLIVAQKPAGPASMPADDCLPIRGEVRPQPPGRPATNSPAALQPRSTYPTSTYPVGNASFNSPGAIATAAAATPEQASQASELRFAPLRDAALNGHFSATGEERNQSMSAIDPLQIGRSMAEDQQPAMKSLPIQNALPTNRFQSSDYIAQNRPATPTYRPEAGQTMPNQLRPGTQRTVDIAVQPASFEQIGAGTAPKLAAIDPLEVARSLETTPAPMVAIPARPQPSASATDATLSSFPPLSR